MTDQTPSTEDVRYFYACGLLDHGTLAEEPADVEAARATFDAWLAAHDAARDRKAVAKAWDEGVATALNHAILNDDGITLRLEHLDGRPWANPYADRIEAGHE